MALYEVKHILLWYAVKGDTVTAEVRSYVGTYGFNEGSVRFTETDLKKAAVARGEKTWDETDIVTLMGCDHWIGDTEISELVGDVAEQQAPAFVDVEPPNGSIIGELVKIKRNAEIKTVIA